MGRRLQDSLNDARRSVRALRPGHLEGTRLPDAVSALAEQWSGEHAVPAVFAVTGDAEPLHTMVEITLFRVAQEALTNVAKHAAASRVALTLSYLEDVVLLDVRDDGVGFAPEADPSGAGDSGFGLAGMRQRLMGVNGILDVESAPGEGTAISATVPATPAEGGI